MSKHFNILEIRCAKFSKKCKTNIIEFGENFIFDKYLFSKFAKSIMCLNYLHISTSVTSHNGF